MSFFKKLFKFKEVKEQADQELIPDIHGDEAELTQEVVQAMQEKETEEVVQAIQEEEAEEVVQAIQEEEAEEVVQAIQKEEAEEVVQAIQKEETEEVVQNKKGGFFSKLVSGLAKTRKNILDGVENVLRSFTKIDEELYEELEEALIMADLGVETTMEIMEELRTKVKENKETEPSKLRELIIQIITGKISQGDHELNIKPGEPTVILVIGVNGVGKTTTIGKLAHHLKQQKKKVLVAAADTFRAAAIEQLEVWATRSGVDVIKHHEGADPGAVVYDALQAAKARKTDILICDTAGRLHNKTNLMKELEKIFKIIEREYPGANREVLLVLDATTGQNAIQQVKLFKEAAQISGIVLTKLDGTAKGGIIIGINSSMNIPVKFVGVGEGINDLQPFNSEEFSKALFYN